MFWTEDISVLLKPVLIPTDYMSFDEKINALTRLIIFIGLISALILQDSRIILLVIILVIILAIIYQYYITYQIDVKESFLNEKDLDIVDNMICVKPTKNNPLMNPNLIEIVDYDKYDISGACPSYSGQTAEDIDEIFERSMFLNATDIYNRGSSKRQFYTVPVNKIPNDQEMFANWLYNRGPSCKENNGLKCYINIHRDLRL